MRTLSLSLVLSCSFPAGAWSQSSVLHHWPGGANGDQFGYVVDGAGDVDGDGVPDLIVGANRDDDAGGDSGRVSVFSGADGSLLYAWNGARAQAQMGAAVAGVGDVNQDGHDDFLHSELNPFSSHPGVVFLRSGQDGSILHQWSGGGSDGFGFAVAGIGDVTGDGVPDLAISARYETGTFWQGGKVRVYSGATGGVVHTYEGASSNAQIGAWIAGGKDLDGDGLADFALGNAAQDEVVVYGGATGVELYTITRAGGFGSHLDFSDDVDGDGLADLIIGDFSSPGNAYLYSGVDGSLIWRRSGTNSLDAYGWAVAALGDTNGDGIPDLAIGAYGVDQVDSASGVVQVRSGAPDAALLVEYNGNQYSALLGWSVAGCGDVDGDGLGDLIVGAVPPFHAPVFPGYVRVYSGACQGEVAEYGAGHGGSGGFVPRLSAEGCPAVSGSFGIRLDQSLGGASGFLLLGFSATSLPLFGGELLVAAPWVKIPLSTPGVGDGAGVRELRVSLPDDPGLIDFQFFLQGILADAGASQGFSMSNGLAATIR